ncbi:DNA cytosine methyltransferase [Ruminococcus sp.]|uniref:DNA cytosine methyltransferase n=1 Tax=Ruminococcus sp. TaxID=41978 RepID=UPI001B72C452|nr:DNA cytosine methyltransferase [Ruminococcus sp.]MBP5431009.1 DNA cytosine methyltransferase [Ruminococcus sp.]
MRQYTFFDELIVDNFAGGGGASTGIELATGRPVDIAINHDPDAILMHKTNHPNTTHYCESVWDVEPEKICQGHPVGLMWLSPDCKHFSRAKGGKPRDKNIRGLAWIAVRWAATVRPRVIILENVPEFVTWGPLSADGFPNKNKIGVTFKSFVNALKLHGYDVKWKELKACDYGAPTIRKRFFLIARCDGQPIIFPEPTHGAGRKPYRTAAECIDWSIPCKSIFGRCKPLAEKTMIRIARGLDKFTLKADSPFIVPIGYGEREGQSPRGNSIEVPLSTIVSTVKQALVAPNLIQYHSETSGHEVRGQALTEPIMTVDASPRYGLSAAHIVKYYSGDNYSDCGAPLGTVTTKDRCGLVESHLCVLRNGADCKALTAPLPTICSGGEHLGIVRTYLKKYPPETSVGHWPEVRELLNRYCGYSMADNEILLLEIAGEQYYISDIGLRMLEPRELYNAQGFPRDYIIDHDYKGNTYPRTKQVARCGNAVPPPFAEALVRANLPEMCGAKIYTMEELRSVI